MRAEVVNETLRLTCDWSEEDDKSRAATMEWLAQGYERVELVLESKPAAVPQLDDRSLAQRDMLDRVARHMPTPAPVTWVPDAFANMDDRFSAVLTPHGVECVRQRPEPFVVQGDRYPIVGEQVVGTLGQFMRTFDGIACFASNRLVAVDRLMAVDVPEELRKAADPRAERIEAGE